MTASKANEQRRRLLITATGGAATVAAGFSIWPFIASLKPSARAKLSGSPVRVNLGAIESGAQITVVWRGMPIWVLRRSSSMSDALQHPHWLANLRDPDSDVLSQQPPYARNRTRSLREDIFVAVALCTHLGCVPLFRPIDAVASGDDDWMGGYYCPCHGSRFDFAGRVTQNVPAPTNLVVPPHRYLANDILEIGVNHTAA